MTDPIDLDAAREKKKKKASRPKPDIPNTDWGLELRTDADGQITPDVGNAAILLANDEAWAGCLTYDEFADRCYWSGDAPPLSGIERPRAGQEIADHHATYVHHWFARRRFISLKKTAVQDAIVSACRSNTVHPLKAYLKRLEWDGKLRLSEWLTNYLGADLNVYTAGVARWWLISAVARVAKPGCQADHMLVLEGPQGLGKSTALRILAGDWYLPTLPDIKNPAAGHMLQGNWIAEVGELDALRRQDLTTVKDFVTRTVDKYRPPYGRFQLSRPRQLVFAATTNEDSYLQDATGGRRFWPVLTRQLRREELARDRDQLWAEAVAAYRTGEHWWPDADREAGVRLEQSARHAVDEWQETIRAWVESKDRSGFSIGEVLAGALSLEPGKWSRADQTRVGLALKMLGYPVRRARVDGQQGKRYYPEQSQLSIPGEG